MKLRSATCPGLSTLTPFALPTYHAQISNYSMSSAPNQRHRAHNSIPSFLLTQNQLRPPLSLAPSPSPSGSSKLRSRPQGREGCHLFHERCTGELLKVAERWRCEPGADGRVFVCVREENEKAYSKKGEDGRADYGG